MNRTARPDNFRSDGMEQRISIERMEQAVNIFGSFDENIRLLEKEFNVTVTNRDGELRISGEAEDVMHAAKAVQAMLTLSSRGEALGEQNVRYIIDMVRTGKEEPLRQLAGDVLCISAKGRPVKPKTLGQKEYIASVLKNTVTIGVGPAGTGKTYLAVAAAVQAFREKQVNRIILTRPAVEAGERLGFLPGDLQSKVDPYLRPLYDALFDMLGAETYQKYLERGNIEVAPLAYMRGRTLDDSFIILDEAQNTSREQMKMFLTRLDVLGISGGKDSAALAIYLKRLYPQLPIEYYNTDTKCELAETEKLIENLKSYLGHIEILVAAEDSPEPTPFDHFLKISGGYLPSPQARWCTQKMKLAEFERFVGDDPTISYVGIRGDEDREGYVSTKPNIQAIFPFRKNIWSIDVIHNVMQNSNIGVISSLYKEYASNDIFDEAIQIIEIPTSKKFLLSRKFNALLDLSVKTFNKVVFEYLKTTDYPVGKLEDFPLIDNEDVLVKEDIFNILKDNGVEVPAYYNPIPIEVDGEVGTYNRSRSGCYFCFFQQRIEWIWLLEQHPDLYKKAMEYEKDGYTWIQGETLEELSRPERVRQIKLDHIKKQANLKGKNSSGLLVDMFDDDDEIPCANCFI